MPHFTKDHGDRVIKSYLAAMMLHCAVNRAACIHRHERQLPGGQWMGVDMLSGFRGKKRRWRKLDDPMVPNSHEEKQQVDCYMGRGNNKFSSLMHYKVK